MQIHVDAATSPAGVELVNPDDFTAFSVVLHGASADSVRTTLAVIGRVDDDEHVFVGRDKLAALAGARTADPTWLAQLDGMMEYAARHGWIDRGGRIRAHVERR